MKKIILIAMAFCASSQAFAGTFTAKVEQILLYDEGNIVYVYPKGGVQNPPSCHGSNGDYATIKMDRPMAKEYLSALLAAMMAKKDVIFRVSDDCQEQSFAVKLRYFTVKDE
ncbi:hypothetical protein QSV34_07630 [Porticoccus sp. W117]|uniref:hypothetical protein n=1 Tax=Porticoccus sp. W117 TaxID=3054777 RepID=UPI00259886C7|nr:hypothetical protein [Porticoccus sp. W117]MDM3871224.1 hypothetical protein [Porticoccus sp. W117]